MSHLKLVTFPNGTHKNADSIYFTSSLEGIFMTIHVQLYSPLNLTEYNIIYYFKFISQTLLGGPTDSQLSVHECYLL